ncbi:MAG: hypothetical protein HRO68_10115 [Nitrosopumilus sp.]|nr:hypothetical protein [Nitrosopumilus sp.]
MMASQFGSAAGRAGMNSYQSSRGMSGSDGESVLDNNFSFGGLGASSFADKPNPLSQGMALQTAGKEAIFAGSIAATQTLAKTRIPTPSGNTDGGDSTGGQQDNDNIQDDDQK